MFLNVFLGAARGGMCASFSRGADVLRDYLAEPRHIDLRNCDPSARSAYFLVGGTDDSPLPASECHARSRCARAFFLRADQPTSIVVILTRM